jgi:hypothetical protein
MSGIFIKGSIKAGGFWLLYTGAAEDEALLEEIWDDITHLVFDLLYQTDIASCRSRGSQIRLTGEGSF